MIISIIVIAIEWEQKSEKCFSFSTTKKQLLLILHLISSLNAVQYELLEKTTDQTNSNNNFEYTKENFIPDSKPSWKLRLLPSLRTSIKPSDSKSIINHNQSLSLKQRKSELTRLPRIMCMQDKFICDQYGIVFPSKDALSKDSAGFFYRC